MWWIKWAWVWMNCELKIWQSVLNSIQPKTNIISLKIIINWRRKNISILFDKNETHVYEWEPNVNMYQSGARVKFCTIKRKGIWNDTWPTQNTIPTYITSYSVHGNRSLQTATHHFNSLNLETVAKQQ